MRMILSVSILLAIACTMQASDRYKAKGKGAWAFAVAKSNCSNCSVSCSDGSCASVKTTVISSVKTEPATIIEAPQQTGTITTGSCASGSCGGSTSYSSGLFRRRR